MTTAARSKTPKAKRLAKQGVEVVSLRLRRGRVDLTACLHDLVRRDVTNLLVEGGPTIITALVEASCVDEALVFVAPKLIGGDNAPSALGGRGVAGVDAALSPYAVRMRRIGPDTLWRMRFTDPYVLARASSSLREGT